MTSQAHSLGTLRRLPIELREEIYSLVLVKPEPIFLKFEPNEPDYTKLPAELDNRAMRFGKGHHEATKSNFRKLLSQLKYGSIEFTVDPSKPTHIALLLTSKSVCGEAAKVLYRDNKIVIEDALTFCLWIDPLTPYHKYITNLTFWIGDELWDQDGWVYILSQLFRFEGLKLLRVYFQISSYPCRIDNFQKTWVEGQRMPETGQDPLEELEFLAENCGVQIEMGFFDSLLHSDLYNGWSQKKTLRGLL
ncbi:hypothetical protein F5B20DRAFT_567203 [Whalleya microplaca]|nr:hypothetical protein F5B20DRAFT_567203 [Whalleya microplaca]